MVDYQCKICLNKQARGLILLMCVIRRHPFNPTLRKWWKRYQAQGHEGLKPVSRRPRSSPNQKVFIQEEEWNLCFYMQLRFLFSIQCWVRKLKIIRDCRNGEEESSPVGFERVSHPNKIRLDLTLRE